MTPLECAAPANDLGPAAWPETDTPDQVAFRQLRHHTKNTLQRVLSEVATCPGLKASAAGRALASDLERRIMLSATLSDALFAVVTRPRPLATRLEALTRAAVDLMADPDQIITTTVTVIGELPALRADLLVRAAHELVGNAVKHGMHVRMVGRIEVLVRAGEGLVEMTVADDGWGLGDCLARGEGLRIAHLLAHEQGGRLVLERTHGMTVATLTLPHAAPEAIMEGAR